MSDIDTTLTDEAVKIVTGARRDAYGIPERNFRRIALAWEALTDRAYSDSDVALMMVALKLVRESHHHQRDNIVDGIGYLLTADAVTPKPITDDERRSIGINPVADPSGRLAAIAASQDFYHAVPDNNLKTCVNVTCDWYDKSVPKDHQHINTGAGSANHKGRYASSFATHPAAEKLMG